MKKINRTIAAFILGTVALFILSSIAQVRWDDITASRFRAPGVSLRIVLDTEGNAPEYALASRMSSSAGILSDLGRKYPLWALRQALNVTDDIRKSTLFLAEYIRSQNRKIDGPTSLVEATAFLHYSAKYGISPELAVAVGNTESHFNPGARSGYGSAGVMQVTWRVHSNLLKANGIISEEELYDPEKGIAAGCLLISRYMRTYGNTQKALGRYYGGSASVYWKRVSRNLSRLKRAQAMANRS